MSSDMTAKEILIVRLVDGYGSSQGHVTQGTIDAMVAEVADFRLDAVEHACKRFSSGQVDGHNNDFAPSAAKLAQQAKMFHDVLTGLDRDRAERPKIVSYRIGALPPPGTEPLGPTKLELDGMMQDVSDLTHDEKIEAIRTGKRPDQIQSDPVKVAIPKIKGFGA